MAAPLAAADVVSIGGSLTSVVPARLLDSRPGESTVDGVMAGGGLLGAGGVVELPVVGRGGVGTGASAVVLNVTVTEAKAAGYVTVWPCGEPRPLASNLNYGPGDTVPNAVVSKVGAGGKVCLFTLAPTHLIADVNGWFGLGSGFVPVVPARLLDSRPGESTVDGVMAGGGLLGAGGVVELPVVGRGGVGTGASAVVLNVTVTEAKAAGYVTVWPCGEPRPLASNLNYGPGDTVPNAVVSKVGAGGKVCLFTLAPTHLIADVNGWFGLGSGFVPVVPARLLDSRPGESTVDGVMAGGGLLGAGGVVELPVVGRGGVGTGASAVVLNVTVTEAKAAGYVTVWPCGEPRPLASNLNYGPGDTVPNAVVSKVGAGGKVCLFTLAPTHLIADVNATVNIDWAMDVIPASGTIMFDHTWVRSVTGNSNTGGTVRFAPGTPNSFAVGGHVVLVPQALVPGGLVGKIISVTSNADGSIVVTYIPSTLGAAFAGVSYQYEGPMTPTPVSAGQAPLTQGLAECEGDGGDFTMSRSAEVGFTDGEFELHTGWFGADVAVRLDGQAELTLAVSLSAGVTCTVALPEFTIVIPFATIEIEPEFGLSVSGSVSSSFSVAVPFSIGMEAGTGGVKPIFDANAIGSGGIDPGIGQSLGVTVTASVSATPVIKFLGLAGGGVELGAQVAASTNAIDVPCAAITANLFAKLKIEIGKFGLEKEFATDKLTSPNWKIWEKTDGCPVPPTTTSTSTTSTTPTTTTTTTLPGAPTVYNGLAGTITYTRQMSRWTNDGFTLEQDFSVTATIPTDAPISIGQLLDESPVARFASYSGYVRNESQDFPSSNFECAYSANNSEGLMLLRLFAGSTASSVTAGTQYQLYMNPFIDVLPQSAFSIWSSNSCDGGRSQVHWGTPGRQEQVGGAWCADGVTPDHPYCLVPITFDSTGQAHVTLHLIGDNYGQPTVDDVTLNLQAVQL